MTRNGRVRTVSKLAVNAPWLSHAALALLEYMVDQGDDMTLRDLTQAGAGWSEADVQGMLAELQAAGLVEPAGSIQHLTRPSPRAHRTLWEPTDHARKMAR